jgi:2-polyprenyl-3-methyl-5-hydroxy-6-metoxy-1,4-benzoquinol methylase
MPLIHYEACPACGDKSISLQFTVKDHSVTGESFPVWQCNGCTLRFTQDVPDQNEIGAYYQSENYISHTETKKGLINSLYHFVRKRTLSSKLTLIKKETGKSVGNLLDIGAGTGAFSAYMQQQGWKVTALEPDPAARQRAAVLYKLDLKDTAALSSLNEGSSDAITMWHALEHVHDLHGYLDAIKRLLASSGKAFIAVPNYTSLDADTYKSDWAAYDVPRHLYHFSPASMKRLLAQHGLNLNGIEPMWYDSFYVSMLSEKYRHGGSNNMSALFTGLRSNRRAMADAEKCSSLIYIISK